MEKKSVRERLRPLGEALAGGAIGLALAGTGEALAMIASGGLSAAEGAGLSVFAAGLHGILGAVAGVGLGMVLLPLLGVLTQRRLLAFLAARGGVGALSAFLAADLGFTVLGTFRISRDGGLSLPVAALLALLGGTLLALGVALAVRSLTRRLPLGLASLVFFVGLFLLGRALLAGSPAAASDAEGQASKVRPNVVLVVTDTLRADSTGPWGGPEGATPHLDAFAAEAVRFENFYANAAWTRPAVSTLLTGQQPGRHGVQHKVDPLPSEGPNLAEAFRKAGYATAASVTNVNLAPDFGFERGFSAYRYHAPSRPLGAEGAAQRLSVINVARLIQERLSDALVVERFYGEGPTITRDALALVDELGDGPFFLWVHYMDPHDPYVERPWNGKGVARVRTPEPEISQAPYLRGLYQGEVTYWDAAFGDLMKGLEERGLLETTVVAMTADHGEEFADHGGFWHGRTLFEEQVRVPLLVRLAGGEQGGTTRRDPAAQIDVTPTLLALAGVALPPEMDGVPLLAETPPEPRPVLMEEDHDGAVLTGLYWDGLKLVKANEGNPNGLPALAVYDLAADPGEARPLAADDPRVAELQSVLEGHLAGRPPPKKKSGEAVEVDAALEEDLRALGYVQ
ncbi:MAG: sulfatase [Deltaproteobacteria bacterium]|nr:sulfatase [Deltaproteobacteria bacterium]